MKANEVARYRELAAASLPSLTRLATALAGDPHRGDDLVQEALVKAYVHWRRLRSADDPRAYLRRILVRCHLDAVRSSRRREVPSGDSRTALPDRPDPHDGVARVDEQLPLLEALARLTPRQRTVVALRFVEDLDVATTAAALDISAGTVKSTTYDALRILRRHLAEHDDLDATGGRR